MSEAQVLAWADAYRERNGRWPNADSGAVEGSPGVTWNAVEDALRVGLRGLSGERSLARLLAEHRGARNKARPPLLTAEQILAWADEYHTLTGRWPAVAAGPIPGSGGDTWSGVDQALRRGRRGLPGGDSLCRLLDRNGRTQGRHGG